MKKFLLSGTVVLGLLSTNVNAQFFPYPGKFYLPNGTALTPNGNKDFHLGRSRLSVGLDSLSRAIPDENLQTKGVFSLYNRWDFKAQDDVKISIGNVGEALNGWNRMHFTDGLNWGFPTTGRWNIGQYKNRTDNSYFQAMMYDGWGTSFYTNPNWNTLPRTLTNDELSNYRRFLVGIDGKLWVGRWNNTELQATATAKPDYSIYSKGKILVDQIDVNNYVQIGNNVTPLSTNSATPTGYKLYVEGGILSERVKVALKNTENWADFVFDKSYNLNSLEYVEKYIKNNKHLPNVPSAQEMVDQGLDVVKTDALLLQKIEELTLYVIELNKQLKEETKSRQAAEASMKKLLSTRK